MIVFQALLVSAPIARRHWLFVPRQQSRHADAARLLCCDHHAHMGAWSRETTRTKPVAPEPHLASESAWRLDRTDAKDREVTMKTQVRLATGMACITFAAAGCGGGGGGGSGSDDRPSLTMNQSTLQFASPSTGSANFSTIAGTIRNAKGVIYVGASFTTNAIEGVSTPAGSATGLEAMVFPKAGTALGHGIFQDTIVIVACLDPNCTKHLNGSPATVHVTSVVGLAVAPYPVSVQVVEGAPTAAQKVALTYYGGSGNWSALPITDTPNDWLALAAAGGSHLPDELTLNFGPMPAGEHETILRITAESAGYRTETRDVPIAYTVFPLLQASPATPFVVTNQQAAAGQSRTVTVSTRDPSRNTAWNAAPAADSPWLRVTQSSGTTGGQSSLAFDLVPDEVARLRNGHYTGSIVVTPAIAGATAIDVPVGLTLDRTELSTVAPHNLASNKAFTVLIRGNRLDEAVIGSVRIGDTNATSWTLDGPTRITAKFPAMPAGQYAVSISGTGSPANSNARLQLFNEENYAAVRSAAMPIPFVARSLFDSAQRACYAASWTQLAALRRLGSGWANVVAPATFGQIVGIAMSVDGDELLVLDAAAREMVHVDSATLDVKARVPLTDIDPQLPLQNVMLTADDGRIVFSAGADLWSYAPWGDHDLKRLLAGSSLVPNVASGAGNRLALVPGVGSQTFVTFDTFTQTTRTMFAAELNPTIAIADTFGDRWVFARLTSSAPPIVTDSSGAVVGQIPSNYVVDAVLSGDGTRLVVYASSYVSVYDLTPLADGGSVAAPRDVNITRGWLTNRIFLSPAEDEAIVCGGDGVAAVALP